MPSSILTRQIPRLRHNVGLQITATIRPDLSQIYDENRTREKIHRLIQAGTSHFRLNLSHFLPKSSASRNGLSETDYCERWRSLVRLIDDANKEERVHVFIMLDTAGPEFRISKVVSKLDVLERGTEAILSCDEAYTNPDYPVIYLSMPDGFQSFGNNDVLSRQIAFKDGNVLAEVKEHIAPKLLRIAVKHALDASRPQAIKANLPGFELQGITSVSECDLSNINFFLTIHESAQGTDSVGHTFVAIQYIAQSFVRSPEDVTELSRKLEGFKVSVKPLIIPKIETAQAVESGTLEAIVSHSQTAAIMVARGDLGIECSRWLVPAKQREIIRVAHSKLKPVLIATEIYGSMGYPVEGNQAQAWQPNRGEVLDLRHALEAGVDGIVFTAETVTREDPETTVLYAVKQAYHDEKDIEELDLHRDERDKRRENMEFWYGKALGRPTRTQHFSEAPPLSSPADFSTMDWACAAVYRANNRHAVGIFPFTVTGDTVRDMAHFLPYRPILALTDERKTLARLALFGHVYPILVEKVSATFDVRDLKALVQEVMSAFELGAAGEEALATMPHPVRKAKGTDTLVLVRRI